MKNPKHKTQSNETSEKKNKEINKDSNSIRRILAKPTFTCKYITYPRPYQI